MVDLTDLTPGDITGIFSTDGLIISTQQQDKGTTFMVDVVDITPNHYLPIIWYFFEPTILFVVLVSTREFLFLDLAGQ